MLLYDVLSKDKENLTVFSSFHEPIKSGLKDLDNLIESLNPKELVVLAGIEGAGKTSFILDLAFYNSSQHRIPTVIFSSEMNTKGIAKRITNRLDDFQVIPASTPLYLEEVGDSDMPKLKERIAELKSSSLVQLVIIDSADIFYQNLPSTNGQKVIGLHDFFREMKALTKELNITIILTSQIEDNYEITKEIETIEPLVDILMTLEMIETIEDMNKRILEVRKNAHGGKGSVKVKFNRKYARFYDYDKENDDPPVFKEECKSWQNQQCA